MTTTTTTTTTTSISSGRRCSIIILSATIVFIVCVVIIGLCVRFTTTGKVQQVILITLICLLGVVGMAAVITLEIRRRRNANKQKQKQRQRNLTRVNYTLAPTAPPATNGSSWNYSKDYSNRTTFQA